MWDMGWLHVLNMSGDMNIRSNVLPRRFLIKLVCTKPRLMRSLQISRLLEDKEVKGATSCESNGCDHTTSGMLKSPRRHRGTLLNFSATDRRFIRCRL